LRPHRLVGLALLFLSLGSGQGPALGGDSPAESALKAKGLTRSGRVFSDTEAEKPALEKLKDVRGVFATFASAADKQATAEAYQMQVVQLGEQHATLQANLNALTQQINAQNASMAGSRMGRMAGTMTAPLRAQQQQVQAAINETNAMQKVAKSQIPSAKDKSAIDNDVRTKGEAFKTALADLRKVVDEVTKKYDELNADEKVKKSLTDLEKTGHATMKIGPSEPLAAGMKDLDHAERRFLGKKPTTAAKKKTASKGAAKK
jgi:hypothetical protein